MSFNDIRVICDDIEIIETMNLDVRIVKYLSLIFTKPKNTHS